MLYGRLGGETMSLVPAKVSVVLPPLPPGSGALSPERAARFCREVEAMSDATVLGALAVLHKGTTAGRCVEARMEELRKAQEKTEIAKAAPKASGKAEIAVAPPIAVKTSTSTPRPPRVSPGRRARLRSSRRQLPSAPCLSAFCERRGARVAARARSAGG